jgi:hypothetical protein
MAVYTLTAGTLPANTGYPGNVQGLLQLIQSYLSVTSNSALTSVVVSNVTPASSDNDKVWFQTGASVNGAPQSIRLYVNGQWEEFTPFAFGDIVLCDVAASIASPWGIGNTSYVVNGITKLTPTTPTAPTGTQYKVYVGYYE